MPRRPLRLATYNLQKCVGLDLRRRPDRSLAVIDALGADVVVLQEADKRFGTRPAALPRRLAEERGWRVVRFGGHPGSLGWHGNAVLTGPGVTLRRAAHIDLPGLEPRGAVLCDLATRLGEIRVVGVHLGLVKRYRLLQIGAIMRALHDHPRLPTIIAGDFNDWGAARDLDALAGDLDFVTPGHSFPSPKPVAALDRFLISPDLRALEAGVHRTGAARFASDHLPVWVDLTCA